MAFFEGCPVGGLVDGGVDQGPWLQERVGGGVGCKEGEGSKRSKSREGVREGFGGRGGCKGFGCGGVGGRETGPRDGAIFLS